MIMKIPSFSANVHQYSATSPLVLCMYKFVLNLLFIIIFLRAAVQGSG